MKSKKITKADLERMCRNAGMTPVYRGTVNGSEIFIADGFSAPPHTAFRVFGNIDATDHPYGMYVTLWFTPKGEDQIGLGVPLYIDALDGNNRNPQARINSALADAAKRLKQVSLN